MPDAKDAEFLQGALFIDFDRGSHDPWGNLGPEKENRLSGNVRVQVR